jgi:hypothetical protein
MQMAFNIGMLPMKAFLLIPNVMDREPRQMDQIFRGDFRGAAHFARQHHAVRGDQRFASDAGIGIGGQGWPSETDSEVKRYSPLSRMAWFGLLSRDSPV